ncbi:uncharacterized protein LOC123532749 [Mercenaria mercenaria]|uniref:uncharacterized protein LOC123532749 n=1 Tax=Mercenaria mercenaria TaxID=6596 RepID=UPI00234EF906|nr:uncharacterized protein LOC123532749 [Mercenaria mercenaria]
MESSQTASLYISELLDRLGYSYNMIKYRQRMFADADRYCNSRYHIRVTTGGKGEGTTLYYESDVDYMFVARDVICADHPREFCHQRNTTLIQTDQLDTAPGYTTLKLSKLNGKCYKPSIKSALLFSDTNAKYVSSDRFTLAVKQFVRRWRIRSGITSHVRHGPSNPSSFRHLMVDNIRCFKCVCPDILKRWVLRHRPHGWPSPKDVQTISRLDGHVAPVGMKESTNAYMEWRICYTLAELYLMKHLNETQLKVYIILKKVSKSAFQPICKDITSYLMKNVFFWVCEIKGVEKFVPHALTERIIDCLKYLNQCLNENYLPSYMIPDRNLFAGKLDMHQRKQVSDLLVTFLDGGKMFLICDKLRNGMVIMYKNPEILREFGERRDNLEILVLIKTLIISMFYRPGKSLKDVEKAASHNEQYRIVNRQINRLMGFDPHELRRMGRSNQEITDVLEAKVSRLLS